MRKMMTLALPVLVSLSAVANAEAPAKEAICRACHGEGGGMPIMDTYPKLKGQNKGYLISALNDYRAGQRQGGMAAVMSPQAAALTDEDIDALATYYAAQ